MACFLAESRGNAAGQVTEVYRADIKDQAGLLIRPSISSFLMEDAFAWVRV